MNKKERHKRIKNTIRENMNTIIRAKYDIISAGALTNSLALKYELQYELLGVVYQKIAMLTEHQLTDDDLTSLELLTEIISDYGEFVP